MKYRFINSKGQLSIPADIRKRYGIKAGTRISFYEEKDGIKIIPITPELIESNIGFLGKDGHLLKTLMREKKIERKL